MAEWQLAHFACKIWLALGGVARRECWEAAAVEAAVPCLPMVSITLRTYAAVALASARIHVDRGHAGYFAAALNDRDDQLAVRVAQRDLRAKQVRSADVAAAQVRAMTAACS